MGISFQNIQLKGCDLQGFSEELNHLIDETVDITVKELERRFEIMRYHIQHKNTQRSFDASQYFVMILGQTTSTLLG